MAGTRKYVSERARIEYESVEDAIRILQETAAKLGAENMTVELEDDGYGCESSPTIYVGGYVKN